MIISIPTRGRISKQVTLKWIPPAIHNQVLLVCPRDEVFFHKKNWPSVQVVAQPDEITTIAKKRAWMLHFMHDEGVTKTLMMDDDLLFYSRREEQPDRLKYALPEETIHWFAELEKRLTPDTPHGGFGPRQGNHTQPAGWLQGTRMMLALGYHIPTVLANAEHGRINTREDMDVCLQLLRKGLPNQVTHEFVVGQGAYAERGGCEDERTLESSNADAEKLAELHPGLVRVVEKEYKNHPRKEVVCSWKGALREGAQWRAAHSGNTG